MKISSLVWWDRSGNTLGRRCIQETEGKCDSDSRVQRKSHNHSWYFCDNSDYKQYNLKQRKEKNEISIKYLKVESKDTDFRVADGSYTSGVITNGADILNTWHQIG